MTYLTGFTRTLGYQSAQVVSKLVNAGPWLVVPVAYRSKDKLPESSGSSSGSKDGRYPKGNLFEIFSSV